MTSIWFIFLLINLVYGFNPSCMNCKYYVKNTLKSKSELGICNKFSDEINGKKVYNLAIYCRNNEDLCGKSGSNYELKIDDDKKIEEYKEQENVYGSESSVKEDLKKELEEIEKDMLDIFQRMRKHNTKRIYKTAKDLYKLFKK